MRLPGFLQSKHRFFGKTALYETPSDRGVEIDAPVDLRVEEELLRGRCVAQRVRQHPEPVRALVMDFD